jgi:hypothetical protein
MSLSYDEWSAQWEQGRKYTGTQISEQALPSRIESVIKLWNMEMPLAWEREKWDFLKQRGFRRGDELDPQPEHKLEKKLFDCPTWEVKGGTLPMYLSPELNELSFANQRRGQRKIDVLALLKIGDRTTPLVIEMKAKANSCWFAVVENLQHLRLLRSYPQSHLELNPWLKPFEPVPLSDSVGMVLAPPEFLDAKGQKQNSFRQAKDLVRALRDKLGITIYLAAFKDNVPGQIDLR